MVWEFDRYLWGYRELSKRHIRPTFRISGKNIIIFSAERVLAECVSMLEIKIAEKIGLAASRAGGAGFWCRRAPPGRPRPSPVSPGPAPHLPLPLGGPASWPHLGLSAERPPAPSTVVRAGGGLCLARTWLSQMQKTRRVWVFLSTSETRKAQQSAKGNKM